MVNKRGWLRIVEAFLAVVLVFSVFLIVSERREIVSDTDYSKKITYILEEISKNNSMRQKIVEDDLEYLQDIDILSEGVFDRNFFNFTNRICNTEEACGMMNYPTTSGEIYANERLISSDIETYRPKRVKIFIWRKN